MADPTRGTQTAIFSWIEAGYKPRRRHSTLGYLSPADYEQRTQESRIGPSP